ncbi:hypothetical protein AB1N83_006373 [Pleurotus pulmonarius]
MSPCPININLYYERTLVDAQWNLILSATESRVGVSVSAPPSPRPLPRPLPRPPSSRRRSTLSLPPRYEKSTRPLPARPLPKPPVPSKDGTPNLISAQTPSRSGEESPPPVPPKDRPRKFTLPSFLAPTINNVPPPTRHPSLRLSRRISFSPFRRVLRLAKHIRPLFPVQSARRDRIMEPSFP